MFLLQYFPAVGASNSGIDWCQSQSVMGGRKTFKVFHECGDSLVAPALILALTILAELVGRSRPDAKDLQSQPLYLV
ncbi:Myo-inositol-1-phosphate synthase [Tulasnella sp. 417]|nr:Myo-inositol-1-phosphate synthase [Tulasnella sp. 417]